MPITAEARFRSYCITDENGCWLWQGALSHNGYADRISVEGKRMRPTHYALALAGRPVPDGLEIDHLCMIPSCVNPDHLEAVTRSENERRKHAARPTCRNGHPKDESPRYTGRGRDECQVCRREASARYYARSK